MDRYFEFLAIVPATLTSFGLSTIYAVLQHGFNYGAIGIVLVVMFTFILLVVRFSYYLVFAMLALAVFDGLQILSSNASDGMLIVNNMSLGTAIILGLFSAWNRETTLRREFDTALELGAARKEVSKLELSNQALRAAARRASEGAQAHLVVSYRRSDTATVTGRIVDRLIFIFGEKSVFVDIDNIPLGVDFRAHIVAAIRNADALVAVIGPNWTGKDASGHGRIDDEDDPVRVEVETALQLNLSVIPILVEGARMPEAQELPSCIRELCYKNALEVSSGRDFHRHLDLVMDAVINALGRRRGQIEQARNIDDGAGLRQSGVGSV